MEGLRERKKRETRHALHAAALRLARERGWSATGVGDIAAAAGVSTRTFFGYYATKDDVLLAPWEPALSALDEALSSRPHGGTALQELRSWLVTHVVEGAQDSAELDTLIEQLVDEVPSVAAAVGRVMQRVERALEQALRADLRCTSEDPLPAVAAAATVAALDRSTSFSGAALSAQGGREALARLDVALAFVEHGLAGAHGSASHAPAPR